MSSDYSSNPYAASAVPVPSPAMVASDDRLDYAKSLTYVFGSPDWLVNVFGVVLCTLVGSVIPVLPVMVLVGYQFEIIEGLTLNPHQRYPSFKFDQILRYLVRGLYPSLVAFVCALAGIPIVLFVIGLPILVMALGMRAFGQDAAWLVGLVMVPVIVLAALACGIALNLVMLPLVLRAGLSQDIGTAFNFTFVKDFIRRMWKDALKAGLFLFVAAIAAQFVGLLLFCVGTFVTVAVVQLAQAHLGMQLYRIYLSRGGETIPMTPCSDPFSIS